MAIEFPPSLWGRVEAGEVDLADLLSLAETRRGATLYRCAECGRGRPAFALYDTREREDFPADWTCDRHFVDAERGAA